MQFVTIFQRKLRKFLKGLFPIAKIITFKIFIMLIKFINCKILIIARMLHAMKYSIIKKKLITLSRCV